VAIVPACGSVFRDANRSAGSIAYEHLLGRDVSNLHVVWNSCATMIGFAAAFFAVAGWRFRELA
jgi:hypothetical protein